MLNWIIDFSLRNRAIVLVAVAVLIAAGAWSLQYIDIDAFPDTTPVMVQVNTTAPSLSPEEVEQQITFPIEQVISGLPDLEKLRSISKFGMSQVVVTFKDGTDIYFARQLIGERLATVELPEGIERPKMGPVSTGLGEVFHYVVRSKGVDIAALPRARRVEMLTELRTIHDWIIRPQMRTVVGSAEVNSWGGYEKQYQVRINPDQVIKHGLTFDEVVTAVKNNNRNVGGGNITRNAEMLLVHGIGRTVNVEQIENIVIRAKDGVPIRVRDVADVQIGHEIRRGAVTADGKGEVVYGLGFMLMGENSHAVTRSLKEKMEEVKSNLPPGVEVETVYDRTELVDHVIGTVEQNLFEGGLLVIAVLFLFLGNLRAGLIVALAIPLSMLCAFSGMLRFGIAASLLSLGSIDFGLVVDSSVVMIENCVRRLAAGVPPGQTRLDVVREAALEVRKPTMFGEMIIMIVYLPILTLEGVEGKLFRPMALTVIFALAGSMVLSLTLMPVLASYLLPKRLQEREPFLIRWIKRAYQPVLHFTMHQKVAVIGFALVRVGGRLRIDRAEPGRRIRAKTVGGRYRHQRRSSGGNRSRRVDSLQHADGAGDLERVPRRSRTRLESHWQRGSRDRSDGNRTDRHVHHSEAAEAMDARQDAGSTDRVDSTVPARVARPTHRDDAADRNARERDDQRHPFRRGREALWRRL